MEEESSVSALYNYFSLILNTIFIISLLLLIQISNG